MDAALENAAEATETSPPPEPHVIKRHNGDPLDPAMDFVYGPPAELGEVLSANSSLKIGVEPKSRVWRFSLAVIVAGVILGAFRLYVNLKHAEPGVVYELAWPPYLIAALGFLLTYYATRFRHQVSYVCERGAVQYQLEGRRDGLKKTDLLYYSAAAELRVKTVRQYVNGAYTGTTYSYLWTDPQGKKLMLLKGTYKSKQGTPKPGDAYWFALAAECAWSTHYLEQVNARLKQDGYADFNIDAAHSVRLGPGFIEFKIKGESHRLTSEDIKSCTISSGVFLIQTHDAKRFGRQGKYKFEYAKMANARVFLTALRQLIALPG